MDEKANQSIILFNINNIRLNILYFYGLNLRSFILGITNNKKMFGIFKKKSKEEKLQELYASLLKEAHSLSTTNRKMSDQKAFEAEEVMKQIEKLS